MIRKRNEKWKRETSERGRRRKIEGSWKEVGRKKISEDMCDFEGSEKDPHKIEISYGQVAQLVRAPACHAGGRGFEPLLSRHFNMLSWLNWQSS